MTARYPITAVARHLGVTVVTARAWAKKLGISTAAGLTYDQARAVIRAVRAKQGARALRAAWPVR